MAETMVELGRQAKIQKALKLEDFDFKADGENQILLYNNKDTKTTGLFCRKVEINLFGCLKIMKDRPRAEIDKLINDYKHVLMVYGEENMKAGEKLAGNIASAIGEKVEVDLSFSCRKKYYVDRDWHLG